MSCCKTPESELAVNGGPKAIQGFSGQGEPKVGIEEFLELADTWGFSEAAIARIREAVQDEDIGAGPHLTRYYNPRPSKVAALEETAREKFGVKYALALHSGTSALETAYKALAIGPGDQVIVPGYTFFATAAAVVSVGAIPVIAEIDESLTLDPADVEAKITPHTKAIAVVHMGGMNADMDAIMEIADARGVLVVEDVAQACGGYYKGRRLGTFGAAGCFSISSYKIVGAGEAGLVITNDEMTYIRAQNHHDTAACWRPDRYATERMPGELFAGTNYRLSELEGAVNLVQLNKMDEIVDGYRAAKQRIVSQLKPFKGVKIQTVNDPEGEVGYRMALFPRSAEEAKKVCAALCAEGVHSWTRGGEGARDWHLYSYWEHILEKKSASPAGYPWKDPANQGLVPDYSPDMCPRTIDILDRATFINVNRFWTEADCDAVAGAINKVLGAYYEPAE